VPSVGGGICQVATTVFQAAFWAGLPFVERSYHLYWISRYGQPPSGRTGMDATVDDPGVDLKFKNTTSDWIRLDSWVDGSNIGFTIVGVDQGWQVEATKPRIFDVVPTTQVPVRQFDPSLAPGRELWVEHAEDGFRASLIRLVKLDDQIVDEYPFTNWYRPSRNVVLVGGSRVFSAPAPPPAAEPVEPPSDAAAPPVAVPQPAPPAPAPPVARPAAPPSEPVAAGTGADAAGKLAGAGKGLLRPGPPGKR
jgi:hypothetical protein